MDRDTGKPQLRLAVDRQLVASRHVIPVGPHEQVQCAVDLDTHHLPRRSDEGCVQVASTAVAIAIGVSGFNPIAALFWASLVMGLLTPALMWIIMLAVSKREIMGDHANGRWLKSLGWLTTAAVTLSAFALIWTWIF